ncbi:MAG: YnbE family lipoprotein [Chitinivibrionales bacterium]|nr:YnbE family lipoprotein [Chitinivibrionales bacterium]
MKNGLLMLFATLLVIACQPTVTVKHKVEPIHITVDVNVKVQQELEEFFDFEDEIEVDESVESTGKEG